MKIQNWLRRKYPDYHTLINAIFSEEQIRKYLKDYHYKLAVLTKGIKDYNVGTIFFVKKSGSVNDEGIWDGSYHIEGLFKCKDGITSSGYHCLSVSFSGNSYQILESGLKQ